MGMQDYRFALEFKETLARLVKEEVERTRPRYRMATVVSFDRVLRKCTVTFPGDTTNEVVNMGSIQPKEVGQIVRIAGLSGDRYIDDVLGEAYDPVQDLSTDWVYPTPPYSNSWTNYNTSFSGLGYRRTREGIVMLRGLIKSGSVAAIYTLPTGFRPNPGNTHAPVFTVAANLGTARVDVSAAGVISLAIFVGGANNTYVSLDGIYFDSIS